MARRLIGVFAKYWKPGHVKTRLASNIGNQRAAEVARAFLYCLVSRLDTIDAQKQMGFTPTEQSRAFQQMAPSWQLRPQCEGDLGARMTDFFESAFAARYDHALLLGADCPSVPLSHIEEAFALLAVHDVVFGPAEDGGYYLVAARSPMESVPRLMNHGKWGDHGVLARTLAIAERDKISVGLASPWHDVDECPDLKRLREQLSTADQDPHLVALRNRLNNILGAESDIG